MPIELVNHTFATDGGATIDALEDKTAAEELAIGSVCSVC